MMAGFKALRHKTKTPGGPQKCVIIDDVDSKLPFLSGIFEADWSTGKEVF